MSGVLAEEPPPAGLPLLALPNPLVTPHVAGGGTDVFEARAAFILQNLQAVHEGREPMHRVAPPAIS